MIIVDNRQLLSCQDALETLCETNLPGRHALQLMKVLEEVQTHLQHVQEVRTRLATREDEEEAEEEWQEILDDDGVQMDEDPLPRSAIEQIDGIGAKHLYQLRWLLADPDEEDEEEEE
jgi:hypothetical protein